MNIEGYTKMGVDDYCKKCKLEMKLIREQVVAGTKYKVLKCEKCKHEVARAES